MTDDAMTPTPEWLAKHRQEYVPPQQDQNTDRKAFRHLSPFEILHNRGDIEYSHFQAAQKLEKHLYGSMGADVRSSEEHGGNSDVEYARSYHAQMVASAKKEVLPDEWAALNDLLHGLRTVETIGRDRCGASRREICRARGLGLICGGLERLAYHWSFISKKERV